MPNVSFVMLKSPTDWVPYLPLPSTSICTSGNAYCDTLIRCAYQELSCPCRWVKRNRHLVRLTGRYD